MFTLWFHVSSLLVTVPDKVSIKANTCVDVSLSSPCPLSSHLFLPLSFLFLPSPHSLEEAWAKVFSPLLSLSIYKWILLIWERFIRAEVNCLSLTCFYRIHLGDKINFLISYFWKWNKLGWGGGNQSKEMVCRAWGHLPAPETPISQGHPGRRSVVQDGSQGCLGWGE